MSSDRRTLPPPTHDPPPPPNTIHHRATWAMRITSHTSYRFYDTLNSPTVHRNRCTGTPPCLRYLRYLRYIQSVSFKPATVHRAVRNVVRRRIRRRGRGRPPQVLRQEEANVRRARLPQAVSGELSISLGMCSIACAWAGVALKVNVACHRDSSVHFREDLITIGINDPPY